MSKEDILVCLGVAIVAIVMSLLTYALCVIAKTSDEMSEECFNAYIKTKKEEKAKKAEKKALKEKSEDS